ncbi:DUF262 domain-containing protein [Cryobacterium zhongshanensis]|uniref:DUF262 domain-containing protein n=1 Tax=Cryobacterium zhongshanensis TaxID=2928153 RepID=A0AA41QTC8_9MICO|nr:DUF262 domain-containing protein [Cryobacterium zhongshanensis]MCI4657325.1 DUF262 domain-containing protein [Cryobacterium zhongshanensis]
MNMAKLEDEIAARRRDIFTDSYSMSIGELTNLYREGELEVHPEFQRIFRWDDLQKTRLVESILLGIPLPSIFVAQTENGAWDVVDGVQRLSTILQLQGFLTDDNGSLVPPIRLQATNLLPSLAGKEWDNGSDESISFTQAQRLDFKRAKLDLKIVKRESSAETKYDLFQRLNSYGSQATPQEVRSCILIASNRGFYSWLSELASDPHFLATVAISERLVSEQYHLELALRFLILRKLPEGLIATIGNLGDFLTSEAVSMALDPSFDEETEGNAFRKTFALLDDAGNDAMFKRWNETRGRFQGAFLNTAFEVVGMGLGFNIDSYANAEETSAIDRAKSFWSNDQYTTGFATGVRADARMAKSIPLGRQLFAK